MAWTANDRNRLRRDVGATVATLDDDAADALLDEAAEEYSDTGTAKAYARVLAIQGIMANAAKLTSYRQNASSENASDVFKHLKDLLDIWQGNTDKAINVGGSGAFRAGTTKRLPSRIKGYPGW